MAGVPLALRPARHADLPALHALVESAYRGDSARAGWTHEADLLETPRTSIDVLAAAIDDPDELLLIAQADTALVGCVQLTRRPGGIAYLGLFTVDPARQGGGLGRAILAEAESQAMRCLGATHMEMSVVSQRAELIAYYQRRGYVLTGEQRPFPVAVEPPLAMVVLEKPLASAG